MSLRIRVGATALAIACFGALVGCGTPRVDSEAAPNPPAVVLPTPAANDFVSTVMRTKGLNMANLAMFVTTTTTDGISHLSGSGSGAVGQGYGRIEWIQDDGSRFTEVSNGKGLFVQSGGPTDRWTHYADKRATPTSYLVDALRGLGTAMSVVQGGTEQLGGVTATRYVGRIPADADSLSMLALPAEQISGLSDAWRGQWIDVTVWVDGGGRIIRVDRALEIPDTPDGPVSATTSTRLEDFGQAIDLEPPPTESVTEASTST